MSAMLTAIIGFIYAKSHFKIIGDVLQIRNFGLTLNEPENSDCCWSTRVLIEVNFKFVEIRVSFLLKLFESTIGRQLVSLGIIC